MAKIKIWKVLCVTSVASILIWYVTDSCDAKPLDVYDVLVGDDFLDMAEVIESIGAGDDWYDTSRFITDEKSSKKSGNAQLKDVELRERCALPIRRGVCRALIPRWSYDPITKKCLEFKYGGCDGNR